jgi:hypothetical protein
VAGVGSVGAPLATKALTAEIGFRSAFLPNLALRGDLAQAFATTSAARFAASDSQNESWTYWVRPRAGSSGTLRITAALAHPRLAERIYRKLPLFMPF